MDFEWTTDAHQGTFERGGRGALSRGRQAGASALILDGVRAHHQLIVARSVFGGVMPYTHGAYTGSGSLVLWFGSGKQEQDVMYCMGMTGRMFMFMDWTHLESRARRTHFCFCCW